MDLAPLMETGTTGNPVSTEVMKAPM
jgi:hypothetical protein